MGVTVGIARLGHTRRVRSDGRDCGDREAGAHQKGEI